MYGCIKVASVASERRWIEIIIVYNDYTSERRREHLPRVRRPRSPKASHKRVGADRVEKEYRMQTIHEWLSEQDERVLRQYRTRSGPWDEAIDREITDQLEDYPAPALTDLGGRGKMSRPSRI